MLDVPRRLSTQAVSEVVSEPGVKPDPDQRIRLPNHYRQKDFTESLEWAWSSSPTTHCGLPGVSPTTVAVWQESRRHLSEAVRSSPNSATSGARLVLREQGPAGSNDGATAMLHAQVQDRFRLSRCWTLTMLFEFEVSQAAGRVRDPLRVGQREVTKPWQPRMTA